MNKRFQVIEGREALMLEDTVDNYGFGFPFEWVGELNKFCEDLNNSFRKLEREMLDQHSKIQSLEVEKEEWKHSSIRLTNENSILWDEISILREQGAKPSDAFQEYLDSMSTEYEKFWNKKKSKAKDDGVIE